MAKVTSSQRSLLGGIGAYTVHSRHDGRDLTGPARAAFWLKFDREVGPVGLLEAAERARRADMARKAYFARLAYLSARVRRQRRERRGEAGSQAARP